MSTEDTDWLDDQPFYEAMQTYRHISMENQSLVCAAFEEVKGLIRAELPRLKAAGEVGPAELPTLDISIKNDDPEQTYLLKQYARTLQSRVADQRRELARLSAAQPLPGQGEAPIQAGWKPGDNGFAPGLRPAGGSLAFGAELRALPHMQQAADALAAQPKAQPTRTLLEQYDLDQSEDYCKGYHDGRIKGYEVGQRHATEAASAKAQPAAERKPLTDEQIEKLREDTFSTGNPFCPVDSKSMRKAVRAAERAHGIAVMQEPAK